MKLKSFLKAFPMREIAWLDLCRNHSFQSDLVNESIDSVHKTALNDSFMNRSNLVLEFNSLWSTHLIKFTII